MLHIPHLGRSCLCYLAAVLFLELQFSQATAETRSGSWNRPNIILIISDDLNTALGCYGNKDVITPNLDRLAERGIRFTRAYCQSSVCNSSRASIYSGLRSDTIGVLDNETPWPTLPFGLSLMPKYLQEQGYFTATIGKNLDHKRVPDQPYWDVEIREWGKYPDEEIMRERAMLYPSAVGSKYWAHLNVPDEETPDGQVVRDAAEILEQRSRKGEPLFLAVGLRRPHTPFAAPSKYFDMYGTRVLEEPQVPENYLSTIPKAAYNNFVLPDGVYREALPAYYACVSYVDAQVGVVLDAMEKLNLWDNTVVIFTSDHGYHTGHQDMWHKDSLFEQTLRVPLIVAGAGIESAVCDRNVGLVDLYPTFADLAGDSSPPAKLEGRSFLPLLADPQRGWKRNVYSALGRVDENDERTLEGKSVRTDRYRYTEWDGGERGVELYDLERDPAGIENVADEVEYADIKHKLSKLLNAS